jgi:uncharacterized protein YjbJ (UPF0337 family)
MQRQLIDGSRPEVRVRSCDSVPQRTDRSRNQAYDSPLPFLRQDGEEPAIFRRYVQEYVMSMNKDQVKGRAKEAEGKMQEVAGKIVGSKHQEVKGNVKKNLGELQAKFGDLKQNLKDSQKRA